MSTHEERIEASIWLETHHPDAEPAMVERFFASVDAYYEARPIAYRGSDLLNALRQDTQVFNAIAAALIHAEDPDRAWADIASSFRERMTTSEAGRSTAHTEVID